MNLENLVIPTLTREGTVVIKARPGSKKFETMSGMRSTLNVTREDGTVSETSLGTWNKDRFPRSRQFFRGAPWSISKRKWLLKDFPENCQELNDLVKQCRLKYGKSYSDASKIGKFIESCDIYDSNDAFFTHSQYQVRGEEGDAAIRKENALEYLVLQGLCVNKKFAYVTSENSGRLFPSSVKYIMIDTASQKNVRKASREKEIKVKSLYESLNDKKKIAVALNLGLIRSEDTDRELVDDLLWEFANSTNIVSNSGESQQDLFMRMALLNPEELNTQVIINKAKNAGYLKKTKQGYLLFGNQVGKTELEIVEYFNNKSNEELLDRLEKQLDSLG